MQEMILLSITGLSRNYIYNICISLISWIDEVFEMLITQFRSVHLILQNTQIEHIYLNANERILLKIYLCELSKSG